MKSFPAIKTRVTRIFIAVVLSCANIVPLINTAGASAVAPGTNGKIIFSVASGPSNLFTIDPDGTERTALTNDGLNNSYPEWSPDGTKIVFSKYTAPANPDGSTNPGIAIMNADGSNSTVVVSAITSIMPTWSPDGSKIAFVGRQGDTLWQIYIANADGSNATPVTHLTFSPDDVKWSPDGTKLAFDDGGVPGDVYTVNADGGDFTDVIHGNGRLAEFPAWSPDGTKLAYTRGGHLSIANSDGSSQHEVASSSSDTGFFDTFPAWSPDGMDIAFGSTRNTGPYAYITNLFTVNTDGTNLTKVPNGDGAYQVDWQVRPTPSDTTPPSVTGTPASQPNSNDWYSSDVTINWSATDPDSTATTPAPTVVSTEGANQTATSDQSCDPSSNCATGTYTGINIDKTAPAITYAVTPAPNAAGWNNNAVTVTFTCSDALSGIQSCPTPVTINMDGTNQTVTGTAVDKADNTASTTATISLDTTAPVITASTDHAPNVAGWNNTPVTISYTCSDVLSGVQLCTDPQTESADGTYVLSGVAVDNAGNTTSTDTTIRIDQTTPTAGTPTWSTNPVQFGQSATLSVPVSDNLSGVTKGEYFIGSDPGQGNGTTMTLSSGNLSASLGSNLGVGVYSIGYRAQDAAGNWSPTAATMLVIYDPSSNLAMTGKDRKDLVPSLASGDIMPGLVSSTQTDAADYGFTVEYKNGVLDSHNDFMFNYSTGTNCGKSNAQNCHSFSLNANSFAWLIVDQSNSSHGRFQGTATITIDGVTTTNPFTVEGTDGDRLSPATSDTLMLKVYAPGADPATASPLYRASGSMTKGNSVKIQ